MRWHLDKSPILLLLTIGIYTAFKIFYWIDPTTDCLVLSLAVIPPGLLIMVFEFLWIFLALIWEVDRGRGFPRCLLYFTWFNDFLLYPIFISLFIQGLRGLHYSQNCKESWEQKNNLDPRSGMLVLIVFGVYSPDIKYQKLQWWRQNHRVEQLRERLLNRNQMGFELENLRQL